MNFGDLVRNNLNNDQEANEKIVVDAAHRLRKSDCKALLLCANTLHMFAKQVAASSGLPIIHIAHPTVEAVSKKGLRRVALLGTRYTLELDIYHSTLAASGVECLVPEEQDAAAINDTIYNELPRGNFSDRVKQLYFGVIDRLIARGAEGVILGCTEIPLLLRPEDIRIPSFDTMRLHSEAAVDYILGGSESSLK